jgi:light-harvesting complex I chlorophyll a/b binding protein 4
MLLVDWVTIPLVAVAAVGFVVGEQFHPLFGGGIDIPSYLAFQQTPLQTFWPVVVLGIGLFETLTSIPAFEKPVNGDATTNWKIRADHVPGDAGLFGGRKLAVRDLPPSTA